MACLQSGYLTVPSFLQQANKKVMQPMVTRCSDSIALCKRLMKPNLYALYFQVVTLPEYISLENSPLQERRDFQNLLMKNRYGSRQLIIVKSGDL